MKTEGQVLNSEGGDAGGLVTRRRPYVEGAKVPGEPQPVPFSQHLSQEGDGWGEETWFGEHKQARAALGEELQHPYLSRAGDVRAPHQHVLSRQQRSTRQGEAVGPTGDHHRRDRRHLQESFRLLARGGLAGGGSTGLTACRD
jgi:hypothetical protein